MRAPPGIERIVVDNIRAIGHLDLDLTAGKASWLMLLGENGTGKSTVLQVTALALLGARSPLPNWPNCMA